MKLEGQKLLQIWQWSPGIQAERTVADAILVCREYGFTGLLVKALDGCAWMSEFDPTPAAISSVDAARRQADEVHAAGLAYGVWTNPLDEDLAEQAHRTAALAAAPEIDAVFLDAEPYRHFWGPWRPAGRAREFMERLREGAPAAHLVLQPDPRPGRFAELPLEEWLPYVNALAGQHYFTAFQTDPAAEMAQAVELGRQWNLPIFPTLPSDASAEQIAAVVQALAGAGAPGFVLWRLGQANAEQLRAFGGVSLHRPPPVILTDSILEGADPRLPLRLSEPQAMALLQSRGCTVTPEHAIGQAALTAVRLGIPFLNPGPAVEEERRETLNGEEWMVQRFANLTLTWSDRTGTMLHAVNEDSGARSLS